jgi:hypothetical protein
MNSPPKKSLPRPLDTPPIRKLNQRLQTKSPRPGAGNGHAAVCAAQRDISTSRAGRVSITEKR